VTTIVLERLYEKYPDIRISHRFWAEKVQKIGKIAHFVMPDQGKRLRESTFKTLSKTIKYFEEQ
jgi:hypothetical protein